jgi:sec-independent protein translocase protein TatA
VDKSRGATFVCGMIPALALLGDLGGGELLVIGVLALLLFGSKRLPELGRAFGRAMREFKRATSGVEENLREVMRDLPPPPTLKPAPRQVSRGGTATAAAALPAAAAGATPTTTPPSPTTPAPSESATEVAGSSVPPTDAPPAAPPPPPEKNPGAEDEIAS